MFPHNWKRINLTSFRSCSNVSSLLYLVFLDSENWKKNLPSQLCFIFRAQKQWNKIELRNELLYNINNFQFSGVLKLSKPSMKKSLEVVLPMMLSPSCAGITKTSCLPSSNKSTIPINWHKFFYNVKIKKQYCIA